LKKSSKKLLLIWGGGFGPAAATSARLEEKIFAGMCRLHLLRPNVTAPDSKEFFASFLQKRSALL
jgi:hypothetical protein